MIILRFALQHISVGTHLKKWARLNNYFACAHVHILIICMTTFQIPRFATVYCAQQSGNGLLISLLISLLQLV